METTEPPHQVLPGTYHRNHGCREQPIQWRVPKLLTWAKYVPVFRYLREGGCFEHSGKLIETDLHDRVIKAANVTREFFFPPQGYHGEREQVERVFRSVEAVIMRYGSNAFYYLPLLKPDQVNSDNLKSYIISNLNLITSKVPNTETYFRKLVCFYDWIVYGPHKSKTQGLTKTGLT